MIFLYTAKLLDITVNAKLTGAVVAKTFENGPATLTPMQLECLRLAASTDKEIARQLAISPDTVSSHIRAAMKRLGASNRREAMALLTVNPRYGSIEIPKVQIIVPARDTLKVPIASAKALPRPKFLRWELPPLPGTISRIYWISGVFVGLAALMVVGLSLLVLAADLISRHATGGSL